MARAPKAPPQPASSGVWAADAVTSRPVASLAPYAANARVHDDAQVAQIAASIAEFGFVNPVIIDERGEIIAGHGRVLAAQRLGLAQVPTIERGGLTDAQKRGLRLADNKIALNSSWDEKLLAEELAALGEMDGFAVEITGFDGAEIDKMIGKPQAEPLKPNEDAEDPADAEVEPPRQRVARTGDVWLLGEHRLMCGDSTSREDVAKLIGDEPAALLFTSPPYGHQRNYTTGGIGDWDALMRGVFAQAAHAVAPAGQILVNLGLIHRESEWHPYWTDWIEWMRRQGWRRFGWYVWDQGPGLPGDWNGRFAPSFEFIFHFNRQARQANKIIESKWAGEELKMSGLRRPDGTMSGNSHAGRPIQEFRIPDNVVRITRHKERGIETEHPAVFPVKLPAFAIEAYTDKDEIVLEPFSGSGTTLLAGERTGRRVRAMEIGGEYVDLAIARWRTIHPDIPVTLDGDGRSYDEVAAERADG